MSYILAQVHERAPDVEIANCPLKSLREIFMPWFPQTTAPVEERLKVLAEITKRSPAAGWRLLLNLLPNRIAAADPIHRPAFGNWALAWTKGAPNADRWRQETECANMLVDLLGKDLGRWQKLIKHFENLAGPAGTKFLERLQSFDLSSLDSNSRRAITEVIRDKIGLHRKFSDTDWVLPDEILIQLEQAQRRFEPEDAVARNAWLFDELWSVQERAGGKEVTEIDNLRRAAIQQVQDAAGWEGVLALAEAAPAPEQLGAIVSETSSTNDDAKVLPALLRTASSKITRFTRYYVGGRFEVSDGWDWVKGLKTAQWSERDVGELALSLRYGRQTWAFVAEKGPEAEEHYWRNTWHSSVGDAGELKYAVSMLLKHHRPFHSCFVLGMALGKKCPLEPGLVMQALEAGIKGPVAESDRNGFENRRHHLFQLFQWLQEGVKQKASGFDPHRVARLEFGYLELLDGYLARPHTLHAMLKEDPAFFVEVLGVVFRSAHEPVETKAEPPEEEKARARNVYRLLMSWHSVPGSKEDKSIDEDALLVWLQKARSIAEEHGLLEVSEHQIGNVFAHAPFEQDGSWPCIPVRDAIEEAASHDLAAGFELGILNKRGAHNKVLEEGGNPERTLATRFEDWADICKIEWPKTATSLHRVAETYLTQARREDAACELRLRG